MTKKTKVIIGVVAAVVVVAGAVIGMNATKAAPEVMTDTVRTQALTVSATASGEVVAGEKAEVFVKTQGLIDTLPVENGQEVKAGEVLATLSTDAADAQLAQANSALAQAKAGLAQALAGVKSTDAAHTAAGASLSAAQVGLSAAQDARDAAQVSVDRAQTALDAINPISDPDGYAAAAAALAAASASLEQAKVAVAQAEAGVAQAKSAMAQTEPAAGAASVAAARAGVAAATKSVALAQQAIDDATVVAPIDGVVTITQTAAAEAAAAAGTASAVSELAVGSVVAPGSPVFTVYNADKMSFSATVDEADAGQIKVGQKATVTLNAFPNQSFTGTVISVGTMAATTLTGGTVFPFEVSLDATDADLKVGMKGDANVELSVQNNALVVPIGALFSEGSNDYVFVVGEIVAGKPSTITKKAVTVGTMTDTQVEIVDGLAEGDTVALAGDVTLVDGMKIGVAVQ